MLEGASQAGIVLQQTLRLRNCLCSQNTATGSGSVMYRQAAFFDAGRKDGDGVAEILKWGELANEVSWCAVQQTG